MFIHFNEAEESTISMPETPSPADQRTALRREQILDAAARVFAQGGFHRATIHDVARSAGVADGTIYNYFANKPALLFGLLDRLNESDRRAEDLDLPPELDPEAATRAYLRHRLKVISDMDLNVLRVLFSELLIDRELRAEYEQQILTPTTRLAEALFSSWRERGVIRPLDPALTTRATAAVVLGFVVLHLLNDRLTQERWDDVPDLVADMLFNGLKPAREDTDGS